MTKQIIALGLALLSVSIGAQAKSSKDQNDGHRSRPVYGDNIIRFNPLTAMDIGTGPGISYEHIFGEDKNIGLVLPFSLLLSDENDGYYNNGNTRYATYFYFTPGLKFYPFGQRRCTYAIGPNLMLGYGGGERTESQYDPVTQSYYLEQFKTRVFRLGILVNNYFNFQVTPAFNIGAALGLGARYIDHETRTSGGHDVSYNNPIAITGQFTLSIGYRF